MKTVASKNYRVPKGGKFCAILMGDIWRRGCVFLLGFRVMEIFQQSGFILKEIVLKQHNCQLTSKWIHKSKEANFLLVAHEYFIFKK